MPRGNLLLENDVRIMQAMQVSFSLNTSHFMGNSLQRPIGRWYMSTESQESTSRRFSTESQESTSCRFGTLSPSDLATGHKPAGNRPPTDYCGRTQDQLAVRSPVGHPKSYGYNLPGTAWKYSGQGCRGRPRSDSISDSLRTEEPGWR